ncbi:MAG: sialate O-acetylesterase [Tepidisphaerales bacterium]
MNDSTSTALRLPCIYSSGMVVQRGRPLRLSGSASPGQTVTARFDDQPEVAARVAGDGRFQLTLPPQHTPGGPHRITLRCRNEAVVLEDVLVGEVWLCSGQSNMEWPVEAARSPDAELADASYPGIRLFLVPQQQADQPQDDLRVPAGWVAAHPDTVRRFSAVAFFFGRRLHRELGVPVGLVLSSWGGTTAEAWTPLDTLDAHPELRPLADRARLPAEAPPTPHPEPPNTGVSAGWAESELRGDAAEGWRPLPVPGTWQSAGLLHNGSVWFRRTVELTADDLARLDRPATLTLGIIDDMDTTYVNGVEVGRTGSDTPGFWMVRRRYAVPPERLRVGSNVIAVRVFDQWGEGGLLGPADDMVLDLPGRRIGLSGTWQTRVETALPYRTPAGGVSVPPSALYNAMIHPLTPIAVAGALWYQGESNADRGHQYRTLLREMIHAWRRAFQDDFPFFIVQLAAFHPPPTHPGESSWAELRDAQDHVATTTPNTAIVSAIDVGEADDIHPRDKQTVAARLADAALATVYGRPVRWQHPRFVRATFHPDGQVGLFFEHAQGLHTRCDPISGFQIAGDDRRWVWAQARLGGPGGAHVVVSSPEVPAPRAVRYGWHDNPPLSLFNDRNLPLLPFRTDDWPYQSAGRL